VPQDFGELIAKGSWLNQFQHAIVGHRSNVLFVMHTGRVRF
jgi:hypothetical protein